jgi:hypothetical protein
LSRKGYFARWLTIKASLKVRELKDEELNGVVGGKDSARMTIKVSPEYTKSSSTSGSATLRQNG